MHRLIGFDCSLTRTSRSHLIIPSFVLNCCVLHSLAVSSHVCKLELVQGRATLAFSFLMEPFLLAYVRSLVHYEIILVEGKLGLMARLPLLCLVLDVKLTVLEHRVIESRSFLQTHALPL